LGKADLLLASSLDTMATRPLVWAIKSSHWGMVILVSLADLSVKRIPLTDLSIGSSFGVIVIIIMVISECCGISLEWQRDALRGATHTQ